MQQTNSTKSTTNVLAAVAGGLNAGIVIALLAAYLGSAMGIRASGIEVTALHIIVACLVTNFFGGLSFLFLTRHTSHPARAYLGLCLAAATLASMKLVAFPPPGGFAAIAHILHYFVAFSSAVLLPFLVGRGPYFWERSAPTEEKGVGLPQASIGRVLLTLAGLGGAVSSLVMDFNESHVYNQAWAPHARFHGFLFMNLLVGVGSLSLFLLWRPAPMAEDSLRVRIAAFLGTVVPLAFLLPLLVPEASPWPDGFRVTMPVNGNIIMASLMLCFTGIGYSLLRSPQSARS